MYAMEKVILIVKKLLDEKFIGELVIIFNRGGIRIVKRAEYENMT